MMTMKGKTNTFSEVRKREGEETWRIGKYREKENMKEVQFLNAMYPRLKLCPNPLKE